MEAKQSFIRGAIDRFRNMGKETYTRETPAVPTREQMIEQEYSKFSPEMQHAMKAVNHREIGSGAMGRINYGDQPNASGPDKNSYGNTQMNQDWADTFNNRKKGDLEFLGRNIIAKNQVGPEQDTANNLMLAYRVDKIMNENNGDLRGSLRKSQNFGDKEYATSTINAYNTYLNNQQKLTRAK